MILIAIFVQEGPSKNFPHASNLAFEIKLAFYFMT